MTDSQTAGPQAFERKAQAGNNVANLVKRISTEFQSNVPIRTGATDVRQRRVKATYSYTPQNDDELRLDVDDVVDVIGEEEEGWWKGRLKGRVGVFPANFVENMEPPSAGARSGTGSRPESRNDLEDKPKMDDSGELHVSGEIQPKKVHGIGFGNIFGGDQKIELRSVKTADVGKKANDVVKDNLLQKAVLVNGKKPTPSPAPSSTDANSTNSSAAKPKEYARALFAYEAENEDELALQEGDIILIVAKEAEDAGWWVGELNGKRGVFPDNFVEIIPSELVDKDKKAAAQAPGPAPPVVPSKPMKYNPTSTPAATDILKSIVSETKPDAVAIPKLPVIAKENHAKEIQPDKCAPTTPPTADKSDKPNVIKKPLVPSLFGGSKPKQGSLGRLFSGTKSPVTDDKTDHVHRNDVAEADGISGDADKLSHPTALRARNPNKRPPSQAFLKEMAVENIQIGTMSISDDSPVLVKKPTKEASSEFFDNIGKTRHDVGGSEEFVRREEFDKLQAAFESFRRDATDRIHELEKLASKGHKM